MKFKSLFRRKSIAIALKDAEPQLHGPALKRTLNVTDLTSFGIAAIIGAGVFSTIGTASFHGGPAVSLLFVFTAIACGFSALCYAQFASHVPVSGSAYTYAYVTFGELIAWIIGWDLLMEYAIGNIAVAISWSDYFTGLLHGYGVNVPTYFCMDYLSAMRGYDAATQAIGSGKLITDLSEPIQNAYQAWVGAPTLGPIRFIADLPALFIVFIVTALAFVGIKESRTTGNVLVGLKLIIIFLVIVAGSYYVNPDNWSPFAPNGIAGVLKGVSGVFFAYIGFDAISTTAEECKNPQRDLPRSMIYALVICTVLYILISLVLTGMVSYNELNVGDPLAYVFHKNGVDWIAGIIGISAVIALTTVLLVFQLGQPRIWMSMSRDGLLPKVFSKIHPRFNTPSFSTIVTGFLVAIPALFMNLTEVTDLTSIGTLFAFVLVSGGVLLLEKDSNKARFKVPYINAKYIFPAILLVLLIVFMIFSPSSLTALFDTSNWEEFKHRIPVWLFIGITLSLVYQTWKKNYSLIPVLGVVTNLYLMSELGWTNWLRFLLWLLVGLVIYFFYSYRNSKLNKS